MTKPRHLRCVSPNCSHVRVREQMCVKHYKQKYSLGREDKISPIRSSNPTFTDIAPAKKYLSSGEGGLKVRQFNAIEVTFPSGKRKLFTKDGRQIKSKIRF